MKRFSSDARTLQWIDRWVGAPLCLFLTALRRVTGVFRSRAEPGVSSILFLKLAEQGSTVLAHEAVRRAVEKVGRERVYFLVFEENRFIVDALGLVPAANVFAVPTRSAFVMVAGSVRILSAIRARRIDACIDMEFFARFSAALSFLTGARTRVGFHAQFGEGPYRGDLMTHRIRYNPHLHTTRTFTSLVLALEHPPGNLPVFGVLPPESPDLPRFLPSASEREEMKRMLSTMGFPPTGRLVVLNANAGDLLPQRKWSGSNYAELARRTLSGFPGVWVVFTGAPEEGLQVDEIVRSIGHPRCISLAGRTTLRQLLVLFELSEVLVTNDSGPAHFAALTSVDVISLFGPETPLLFAAPGPRSHPLWAGIACSPCVSALNNRQTKCRDNICMKALSVDRVYETLSAVYSRRSA